MILQREDFEKYGWSWESVAEWVAFLARAGIPRWDAEGMEELEEDIERLFSEEDDYDDDEEDESWWWSSSCAPLEGKYQIVPAVFYHSNEDYRVLPCKSWIKKQWKRAKKFIKEHKKEIIIGTVVVRCRDHYYCSYRRRCDSCCRRCDCSRGWRSCCWKFIKPKTTYQ